VKDGVEQPVRRTARSEEVVGSLPQTVDDDGFVVRHSHMKYELRDSPGLGKDNDSK
jgi:nucleobase transporter 1/2